MNVKMEDIMSIENDNKHIAGYIVRRINIDNFQVIKEGTVVFEGEDYEVVDYVNGGQE
ncbi:hypothetical protein [Bacillus pumilus]|uniref:hypothetical protein n=1 Tax=Bacillus pumilus TaxID=1408 RepID=UPI0033057AAE